MFDRIRLGTLFLICLVVPFIGCGSSTTIDSIAVTPSTVAFGAVGLTAQLTATGTIGHGSHPATTQDVTNLVSWKTGSADVATVSSSGLVTSTGPGVIQITATMNGFTGLLSGSSTITVTVTTTPVGPNSNNVTSLSIIPSSQTVASAGETGQFVAIGTTGAGATLNATNSVTWASSSSQIATVNSSGLVTALSQGAATITAIYTNADKTVATATATFTVTNGGGSAAEPIVSLSIIPSAQTVAAPGETGQFIAIAKSGITGLQSNITSQITWSSSSVGVATINASGLALATGKGVAAITAIATNPDGSVVTGSATFTVTGSAGSAPAEPIASVTIIPASLSVPSVGQSGQFIALGTSGVTGLQSNITNQVVWSSSTPGVATIGAATGLATGVGLGTTAITALATNPDGSVVTGAATFAVQGLSTQEVTALTIIPGSQTVTLPLVAPTSPTTNFAAIGTTGSNGLQLNETNTVTWTSSNTAIATIDNAGGVTPVSQGTTTITAQYNNPPIGGTPGNVVTATANLTVNGVASEPLLSIALLPGAQSVQFTGQTSQLVAIGTFSSAPITQNLTSSVTYPLTWNSSNNAVATVTSGGLVTAQGQGAAVITAIATNPDKSVVTGVSTFTVTTGAGQQVTALTIIPGALTLSATGQPGQFIALGTSGATGLQEDVTNSPQLAWSSSIPTYATIGTFGVGVPGEAQGVSAGSTNITAEYTNPAAGSIPASVVTATSSVAVTAAPAAEPLLSVALLPTTVTTLNLEASAQFLSFGTFSTAPTVMDITNGFYHAGFPNSACTAADAAANAAAAQAGTAAPFAQCSFVKVTWASLPFPFDFPINSAGAPGALGGLITADASGTEDVYAVAKNPDGTLVYSTPTGVFNCPYAPPTYGTKTVTVNGVTTTVTDYSAVLNPGTCNALTISDSLLSTLTIFNASQSSTGLNQANWLITAPSATGTPNVIHCGGTTEQAKPEGSVCEATYPNGTVVTLTAPAETGVNFGGWSSNCTAQGVVTAAGPNSCTVIVGGGCTFNVQSQTFICSNDANISVGAVFN